MADSTQTKPISNEAEKEVKTNEEKTPVTQEEEKQEQKIYEAEQTQKTEPDGATKAETPKKEESTGSETDKLVEEIHEVAEELKELNEESEKETVTEQPTDLEPKEETTSSPAEANLQDNQTTKGKEPESIQTKTIQPITTTTTKVSFLSSLKNKFGKKKAEDNLTGSQTVAAPTPTTSKKKGIPKGIIIAAAFVAILILLTAGLAGVTYALGKPVLDSGMKTMALAKETYQLAKAQDIVGAQGKLKETQDSLKTTQQNYAKLAFFKSVPFLSAYVKDGEAGLNAASAGAEAGAIAIDAIVPYADVLGFKGQGSFEGGSAEDRIVKMVETLDKVTPKMEEISGKMEIVKTELAKIDPNRYPQEIKGKPVREKIIQAKTLADEAAVALTDARPMIEVLPQVLGYPTAKRYLVLFQNDGGLRPTGGFMSAFAVLTIDKGKVKPEKSDDIYSLDKKFGRNIQAPDIIQKYLNEKSWHLRNMNLSPDYKVSMDTFKEYYDKLDGEYKVDGIVAIDTQVLEKMVEITGPLEVPGYGTFTTENDKRCNLPQIVCELEYIVDKPLATVVTNRKSDIMGPMMQALLHKAMGGGKEQLAKLVPLGFKLMNEKHVMVYFADEKAQKGAEAFNIAGRIVDYQGDYLHINNANFGGAKSNFYIDEAVEQEISIADDGTVQKKVTLTYTHNEAADNCNLEAGQLCLSGIQRDYFRVYVPQGSELVEGLGSEVDIKPHEELGKTYFDGFFTLRPQSRAKVVLVYKLPFKVQKGQDYSIMIQKQPGTKDSKYTMTVNGKEDTFTLEKDTEKSYKI